MFELETAPAEYSKEEKMWMMTNSTANRWKTKVYDTEWTVLQVEAVRGRELFV